MSFITWCYRFLHFTFISFPLPLISLSHLYIFYFLEITTYTAHAEWDWGGRARSGREGHDPERQGKLAFGMVTSTAESLFMSAFTSFLCSFPHLFSTAVLFPFLSFSRYPSYLLNRLQFSKFGPVALFSILYACSSPRVHIHRLYFLVPSSIWISSFCPSLTDGAYPYHLGPNPVCCISLFYTLNFEIWNTEKGALCLKQLPMCFPPFPPTMPFDFSS